MFTFCKSILLLLFFFFCIRNLLNSYSYAFQLLFCLIPNPIFILNHINRVTPIIVIYPSHSYSLLYILVLIYEIILLSNPIDPITPSALELSPDVKFRGGPIIKKPGSIVFSGS